LHGRRLVTINETEQNDQLNESRVKFITSSDVITARRLYEEPFDFRPTHKSFLTTNHKPIVRGTDEGIWRRIHLLQFSEKIPGSDRVANFRERVLLPELPGILNWALEGLEEYMRDGLNPPTEVTEATKDYRDDMDVVGRWIEARCEIDLVAEVETAVLHADYARWSKVEIGFTVSPITFGRMLSSRGYKAKKVNRKRGICGLRLLKPEPLLKTPF